MASLWRPVDVHSVSLEFGIDNLATLAELRGVDGTRERNHSALPVNSRSMAITIVANCQRRDRLVGAGTGATGEDDAPEAISSSSARMSAIDWRRWRGFFSRQRRTRRATRLSRPDGNAVHSG